MYAPRSRISRAFALLLALAFAAPPALSAAQGGSNKVTICHKGTVITVGPVAALLHVLFHGDAVGSCSVEPPDDGSGGGGGA